MAPQLARWGGARTKVSTQRQRRRARQRLPSQGTAGRPRATKLVAQRPASAARALPAQRAVQARPAEQQRTAALQPLPRQGLPPLPLSRARLQAVLAAQTNRAGWAPARCCAALPPGQAGHATEASGCPAPPMGRTQRPEQQRSRHAQARKSRRRTRCLAALCSCSRRPRTPAGGGARPPASRRGCMRAGQPTRVTVASCPHQLQRHALPEAPAAICARRRTQTGAARVSTAARAPHPTRIAAARERVQCARRGAQAAPLVSRTSTAARSQVCSSSSLHSAASFPSSAHLRCLATACPPKAC